MAFLAGGFWGGWVGGMLPNPTVTVTGLLPNPTSLLPNPSVTVNVTLEDPKVGEGDHVHLL